MTVTGCVSPYQNIRTWVKIGDGDNKATVCAPTSPCRKKQTMAVWGGAVNPPDGHWQGCE